MVPSAADNVPAHAGRSHQAGSIANQKNFAFVLTCGAVGLPMWAEGGSRVGSIDTITPARDSPGCSPGPVLALYSPRRNVGDNSAYSKARDFSHVLGVSTALVV